MAMNSNQLAIEIKAKIDALSDNDKLVDIKVWTAVAEAIVDHIKNNASIVTGSLQSQGVGNLGAPVNSNNINGGQLQ